MATSDGMLLATVKRWSENLDYARDARDRHIAAAARQGVPVELIAKNAKLSEDEIRAILQKFQEAEG